MGSFGTENFRALIFFIFWLFTEFSRFRDRGVIRQLASERHARRSICRSSATRLLQQARRTAFHAGRPCAGFGNLVEAPALRIVDLARPLGYHDGFRRLASVRLIGPPGDLVKRGLPSSILRSGLGPRRRTMWSCRTPDAGFKAAR